MALEATPGLATSDSYATVAEAQSYMDTLVSGTAAWADLTLAQKEGTLKTATRLVDLRYRWLRDPTYPGVQALGFPRTGLYLNSNPVNPLTIPPQIRDAISEFARQLATTDPATLITDVAAQGITRVKASSVEVEFSDKQERSGPRPIPAYVESMIPSQWYEGGEGSWVNDPNASDGQVLFDSV